jgi:hypothetical protein
MHLKKLFFTLLAIGVFGISHVYSQEVMFGFDLQVGLPQGDFKRQIDNRAGVGINGMAGYRFGNTPFMLGLDVGFLNFGKDTREEPLSSTIPDLRVEVENSYNLVRGGLLFRVIPAEMPIRPYLDALVGFNYFYTETVLRQRGSLGSDSPVLRDTNFKDTAFSYGFGAGVQFKVYRDEGKKDGEEESVPYSIYINLMGRYMYGNEAEYLKKGSIILENGSVTYDVIQSTTDLLYFKLGVSVVF